MERVKTSSRASTKKRAKLTRPAILRAGHKVDTFDCGEIALNIWLQKRALPALDERTANTFVVSRGKRVVGYFSLANGAIAHAETSAKVRRNVPDPIPATVLARLAVDVSECGQGLGKDLIHEAMKRTLAGAKYSAARLLIVHPLNKRALDYYRKFGFRPLRGDSSALYLPLETIVDAL